MERRRALRLASLMAVLLMACGWPAAASAADTVAFTIRDKRIVESSGLATDTVGKRYWTINDSGGGGIAYALSPTGKTLGTLRYLAVPTDVEAIALRRNTLYLGDIGDNRRRRKVIKVFTFNRPVPNDQTRPYQAYDFAYPDGAHDAETLLVDQNQRLYVVTKEARGGIYRAPKSLKTRSVNRMTRVGNAPAFVTDGTFLPGDQRIVLRTYVSLAVLNSGTYQEVAREPLPLQPQGESVTVDLDGKSLLVGSEGYRSKVYRVPIPTGLAAVPNAGATPPTQTPTPVPSASAPADGNGAEPDDTPEAVGNDAGTWTAVGLAGALALIAGAVAALVKKG